MSDFDWDDDPNEGEEQTPQGPKVLRDLYNKQKDELNSLNEKFKSLQQVVREQELSKAFAVSGLPEKAVGLFPKDLEPTDENIQKFTADYGGLFNVSPKPEGEGTASEPTAQNVNAETQKQFQQMSQVTQTGAPATSNAMQDLERALNNPNIYDEMSHADFRKLLREAGQLKV